MRWLLVACLVGSLTSVALADTPLRVARSDQRMRVDGSLREWRGARFTELDGGSLAYALAQRDGGLYVAARVRDDAVVRGRTPGKGQDALVLTFAMPTPTGAWAGTEVWLHPGVTGRSAAAAGVAKVGGRPTTAKAVRVVEGPAEQAGRGYVLEAFVPWGAVREADLWQMGRAALRYLDASRLGKARVRVDTAPGRRLAELPRLVSGQGEVDALAQFLKSQRLEGAEPSHDLKGNVFGDEGAERVSLVQSFVVVSGPSIGQGTSFAFTRLPLAGGGSIRSARLDDLTGDGRAELLVTMRQKNADGQREVWGVVDVSSGSPRLVFGIETSKRWAGGEITARLHVERARGVAASIVVEREPAPAADAASLRESPATDVEPILRPWEPVRRRVYRFTGAGFEKVDEQRDPEPPVQEASPPVVSNGSNAPAEPPPSQVAVLQAVKRALGLSASARADQQLSVDVLGDSRPETVYRFGAQLVLVGPGIADGQGYLAFAVPLREGDALAALEHADVTGDGRDELLLRVRQTLDGGVRRDVLLVQQVREQGLQRLLAVEVARSQGQREIRNRVVAAEGALRIEAGRARGWTANDYPFPDEPVGGVGRLQLPWKDARPVRYRLVQGKLQP